MHWCWHYLHICLSLSSPSLHSSLPPFLSSSLSPSLRPSLSPSSPASLPMHAYRDGDMYAALRDAESALSLCPSYQKALRDRLRCLQHLHWNKEADHLLQKYSELYPTDRDFFNRTRADLDLALKSESGKSLWVEFWNREGVSSGSKRGDGVE